MVSIWLICLHYTLEHKIFGASQRECIALLYCCLQGTPSTRWPVSWPQRSRPISILYYARTIGNIITLAWSLERSSIEIASFLAQSGMTHIIKYRDEVEPELQPWFVAHLASWADLILIVIPIVRISMGKMSSSRQATKHPQMTFWTSSNSITWIKNL